MYKISFSHEGKIQHVHAPVSSVSQARVWAHQHGYVLISAKKSEPLIATNHWPRDDRIRLLHSILYYLSIGYSASKSLQMVIEDHVDPKMRVRLGPAVKVLETGAPLSTALDSIGILDQSSKSLIVAGENSGSLREALESVIQHLKAANELWKKLVVPVSWLAVEVFMALSSIWGIQTWFIPYLRNSVTPKDEAAKLAFESQLAIAETLNAGLLIFSIVALSLGVCAVVGFVWGRGEFRATSEELVFRMPGIRALLIDRAFGRSMTVLGRMLMGGVRATKALEIAQTSAALPAVKEWLERAVEGLYSGKTFGESIRSRFLSAGELSAISAAPNQKELGALILSIADAKETRANVATWRAVYMYGLIALAYSGLSGAIAVWLMILQGDGLTASMMSMGDM